MPPPLPIRHDQYLVHHQGQIQGPFDVDFIEAMVMSGVYPAAVIVERVETSERLPFSNLVAATNPRVLPPALPPQFDSQRHASGATLPDPAPKKQRSKKSKPETAVAWIAGVFGVCMVLWMINLVTSSKKPTTSRDGGSAEWNNINSTSSQPESSGPSSTGTNYSPSSSKTTYRPNVTPDPPPLPTYSLSQREQPTDDSKIYRDASGRSYRVSNADYNRLLGMKSALIPKNALIDRSEKERQALSSQLEIDRVTLDRRNEYAVDSFNRKINRLNAMNEPLQDLVDDYNRDVNAKLERVGTPIY